MRALLLSLVLCLAAGPALAADAAQSRAIGYSVDGKYFAFEQFGVQDGSGFPYWDVFIIDLEKDAFAGGAPFRVLVEDETQRLEQARAKAHAQADSALQKLGVTVPADLLLSNPATEVVFDRASVRFNPFYSQFGLMKATPDDGVYELAVRTIDLPIPADCSDPDFPPKGMELTITNRNMGKTATIVKDQTIPASRRCPLYYDIDAIYHPSGFDTPARSVALIGVYSRGFEGDNRRLIAVPFDMIE